MNLCKVWHISNVYSICPVEWQSWNSNLDYVIEYLIKFVILIWNLTKFIDKNCSLPCLKTYIYILIPRKFSFVVKRFLKEGVNYIRHINAL